MRLQAILIVAGAAGVSIVVACEDARFGSTRQAEGSGSSTGSGCDGGGNGDGSSNGPNNTMPLPTDSVPICLNTQRPFSPDCGPTNLLSIAQSCPNDEHELCYMTEADLVAICGTGTVSPGTQFWQLQQCAAAIGLQCSVQGAGSAASEEMCQTPQCAIDAIESALDSGQPVTVGFCLGAAGTGAMVPPKCGPHYVTCTSYTADGLTCLNTLDGTITLYPFDLASTFIQNDMDFNHQSWPNLLACRCPDGSNPGAGAGSACANCQRPTVVSCFDAQHRPIPCPEF